MLHLDHHETSHSITVLFGIMLGVGGAQGPLDGWAYPSLYGVSCSMKDPALAAFESGTGTTTAAHGFCILVLAVRR